MITEINIDLDEIKIFIESDKFVKFLIDNTTDINVPAFILQALFDKIDELKEEEGNK